MKKSSVYRTLQVAAAVAVYSAISVWASTKHVDIVTNTVTNINSLLVILAIAAGLPYFCFKVLGKLYTPPVSRNLDNSSRSGSSALDEDELNAIADQDIEGTMLYRGARYKPEELTISINAKEKNDASSQPAIKYRGVSIENIADKSPPDLTDSLSTERNPQKSAKPKERMKYRGSYID
ncbi:MAG: hypothetical protein LH649_02440 [Pseudanabaena sp. CAN_BIN31]|nr:hypothetical protein [Pseudanabaena sp. CAN_BIN31]